MLFHSLGLYFSGVFSSQITTTGVGSLIVKAACFQRLASLFSWSDEDAKDAVVSLRTGLNYLPLNVNCTQHLFSSSGLFETSAVETSQNGNYNKVYSTIQLIGYTYV